jgi:hypothetical protein
MAVWRLTQFAGVALPRYNTTADLTGGRAESPLLETVNGQFDAWGSRRVIPLAPTITLQGIYAYELVSGIAESWITGGGDTLVTGGGDTLVMSSGGMPSAETALAQLEELRAKIGMVGTLERVALEDDAIIQTMQARLLEVRHQTRREWHGKLVQVDCRWEALGDPYWTDGVLRTVSGLSMTAITSGNAPVRDATLTLTGAIASSAVISGGGHDLTWTGSLTGGQTLTLSGLRVIANGAPSRVTWGSTHNHDVLIELEPGSTALTITGAAAATLSWFDRWQ